MRSTSPITRRDYINTYSRYSHGFMLFFKMILNWVATFLLVTVAVLAGKASSLYISDENDLTHNEIRSYFGGVVSGARKGHNYDIIDIWDQPESTLGKLPLRSASHNNHHDIHFTAFREKFHLRLHKNDWLVRDGLRMETLGRNGSVVDSKVVRGDCHYFGKMVSHNSSSIALSKCNGLTGMFSYDQHDLFVKPLRNDHAEQYRRRRRDAVDPHIVYRRSVDDGSDAAARFCSPPPPERDPETGLTVDEEMIAALDGKILPPSLQSGQKFMELMVTVDNEMRKYHGNDDLDTYVTSILNIVARRFVDPSLDANIHLHLVKFYVLESDEVGTASDQFPTDYTFTVTNNGHDLLDDFCQWQARRNTVDDADPDHWDNAMLITRYDLINPTDGSNSLLGRAPVGGTCHHTRQCSINQDDGLGSALTIAHETGHTLNLNHDSSYGCPDSINIMSAIRSSGENAFSWSMCSQTNIQKFLRNPVSSCLNDEPAGSPISTNELPGTIYSYADQCRFTIDVEGFIYPVNGKVVCSVLACADSGRAWRSSGTPVMEGTECGTDKWCIDGKCVQRVALQGAVDGQWSDWQAIFKPCSRTCGGGVRLRKIRYCNNPRPSNGGRSCEGNSEDFEVCENQPCETSQDEFRDEQCKATSDTPLNGVLYNWLTGYTNGLTGDELCEHKCLSEDRIINGREPFQFIDGTRCWHGEEADADKLELCLGGTCRTFGCDGREGSDAVFDNCGWCNGDGSKCTLVSNSYTGGDSIGFNRVLTLPSGSTRVQLSNLNNRYSYLALKYSNEYVVEGNGRYAPSSGRYSAGNAVVIYTRRNGVEEMTITGPTDGEIVVDAYLVLDPNVNYAAGVNVRPDIRYQYYQPSGAQELYQWTTSSFSECSRTCGGGRQTRSVTCRLMTADRRTVTAEKSLCPQPKPSTRQPCNVDACLAEIPAQWETSQWFPCSETCGQGTRVRMASCIRDGIEAPGMCEDSNKPLIQESCTVQDCPSIDQDCNGLSVKSSGIIDTLGRTTSKSTCTQIIAVAPGKMIELKIIQLSVDCNKESFILKFGRSEQRLCGRIANRLFTIPTNILSIEHNLMDSSLFGGYHLTYSLTDATTQPNPCDRVMTKAKGSITSPNWPNPYGANQMCTTTIVAAPGKTIKLKFKKFVLDGAEPSCLTDSVSITDSANLQSKSVNCGTKKRFNYRSKSNMITVVFRSDSNTQLKGFKANVLHLN
ncbi:A disintegrin and metalloproteinase with thrombospondin motifs 16-like [Asterias rubens]|uniref:A disintegrin and metalloproteinase with thrombospondin motifs 16-like n=1 Tax=Asterias rubens TaxID=7604 RepID=UPI001455C703|nr:A disintegrin and metalloproteinase with thrombospondin motifs 16-like [Asterias rubens]